MESGDGWLSRISEERRSRVRESKWWDSSGRVGRKSSGSNGTFVRGVRGGMIGKYE